MEQDEGHAGAYVAVLDALPDHVREELGNDSSSVSPSYEGKP